MGEWDEARVSFHAPTILRALQHLAPLGAGGRNRAKLEDVRDALGAETGVDTSGLPLVVGDANDAASSLGSAVG